MSYLDSYNKAFLIAGVILSQVEEDDRTIAAERVCSVIGLLDFTQEEEHFLVNAVSALCHPGISHLALTTIIKVGIDKVHGKRVNFPLIDGAPITNG
jgi:hypothetical protein